MPPRAAAISRSETRPSALAMWPMTAEGAAKENRADRAAAVGPPRRPAVELVPVLPPMSAIALMAEQHAEGRADELAVQAIES